MRSSSHGKLVVELSNGETAQFQKRDGLRCGDVVFVGFDLDNNEYNHIIPNKHAALREGHEPAVKSEPVVEDLTERMNHDQINEVSLTDFEELGDFEVFETDDFEVLRSLSQGNEDD